MVSRTLGGASPSSLTEGWTIIADPGKPGSAIPCRGRLDPIEDASLNAPCKFLRGFGITGIAVQRGFAPAMVVTKPARPSPASQTDAARQRERVRPAPNCRR